MQQGVHDEEGEEEVIRYVTEIKHELHDDEVRHVIDGHWDIHDEVFSDVHSLVVEDDHVWLKGHARYFTDGRVEYDT